MGAGLAARIAARRAGRTKEKKGRRRRIETRSLRVLPVPAGPDFPGAQQALLIERSVTVKKNGTWVMRNCAAVLYITSLAPGDDTPGDLLAHVRGHWTVEHLHWLCSRRDLE